VTAEAREKRLAWLTDRLVAKLRRKKAASKAARIRWTKKLAETRGTRILKSSRPAT
jgi:hypothetical protein